MSLTDARERAAMRLNLELEAECGIASGDHLVWCTSFNGMHLRLTFPLALTLSLTLTPTLTQY